MKLNLIFNAYICIFYISNSLFASEFEGPLSPHLGSPKFHILPLFKGERFGNVVVSVKGTVIATWGSSKVLAMRSEDGGKTWGSEIVISNPGFQTGGLTVNEFTGDIVAFVEDHHPPAPISIYISKDDGKSWVKTKTKIEPDKHGNAPSMHMNEHGITLRRGRYKGRLIRPTRWYAGFNQSSLWPKHYSNAIYSDDAGKSWKTSDPFPAKGTGEAALVELSDGSIYFNSRRHWAEEGSNTRRRWTAISTNGGESWENLSICESLPDGAQNSNYGCMGGLTRLAVKGNDILIYSNCDSSNSRTKGTVWVSFNGGKSWPIKRLVFEGSHAYSSLSSGRTGTQTEGIIYHHFESGSFGGSALAFYNLAWILDAPIETGDGFVPQLEDDYGKIQINNDGESKIAFSFFAKRGKIYVIEMSQDLTNWIEWKTHIGKDQTVNVEYTEQPTEETKQIFYRIRY